MFSCRAELFTPRDAHSIHFYSCMHVTIDFIGTYLFDYGYLFKKNHKIISISVCNI